MKVSTPSLAAIFKSPPAPPVTTPIFSQMLLPPGIIFGFAPVARSNRRAKSARKIFVCDLKPMAWPWLAKNGFRFFKPKGAHKRRLLIGRGAGGGREEES